MTIEPKRSSPRARTLALLGLSGAVILPLAIAFSGKPMAPGEGVASLLEREGLWWLCGAAVLLWLCLVERLPMSSIGLRRPTWKTFVFAILAGAALVLVMAIHFGVLVPALHLDASQAGAKRAIILRTPLWFRVLLVARAAVVEEILFRGYMIEKVRQLGGGAAPAVALSVAAFTFAHFAGWGLVQLIPVFASALILALLYVWRRDLPANMIAHFLTDGAGFLIG